MPEEEKVAEQETNIDYIQAINELKQNSVDRAQYDKLREENKRLLNTLVTNQQIEQTKPKREIDVRAIEKKLSKGSRMTSLEGFQAALDIRQADLDAGKIDPFIDANNKNPSPYDLEQAQRRADIYQEIIDYAHGDKDLFAQELSRRMVDPAGYIPRKKNKKIVK